MELVSRISQRSKTIDDAISIAETMRYTAHTTWEHNKYVRVIEVLQELKSQKDLDNNK